MLLVDIIIFVNIAFVEAISINDVGSRDDEKRFFCAENNFVSAGPKNKTVQSPLCDDF